MTHNSSEVPVHFHISWSGKDNWDWERFDSIPEALARAAELVRPDETFTIAEASTDCPVCPVVALVN